MVRRPAWSVRPVRVWQGHWGIVVEEDEVTDPIDEWHEGPAPHSGQAGTPGWTRDDVIRAMVRLGLTDNDSLIAMLAFLRATDKLAQRYDTDFAEVSQRAMIVALDRNRDARMPLTHRLGFWFQRVRTAWHLK
jgi:hypothetical protein